MSHATAAAPSAAKPETSRAFEVIMAPDRARVAQIRRITMAFMRLWDVPAPLAEDVRLAVSELVTNAVEHGHGSVGLRMRNTGSELSVEVTDDNPAPARLRTAEDDDVCGRGLLLVAVLSKEWGVSDDGRTTWCTFLFPTGRA
ncbi:ATP-binding protein [Streptomyces sp. IB2014 016-6]|uniref:ATP-binding protein n=1 Tax=Streptomyces sp. IB2014 016-6 TaxID=2517818 RepID=UPI0011CC576B|nr:ATP-binding protein [Streptomyces sp. IB2014 016-6]TXL87698.1 ATP-binding protein [Streptomyces sp. IB2014 016-6]